MEEMSVMQKQLEDHETRLRSLEKNQTEMRVNLANIEKSQSDIKLMISDQNKLFSNSNNSINTQLTKLINKFVDSDINNKESNNKNSWSLLLKIWGAISAILLMISGFYFGK